MATSPTTQVLIAHSGQAVEIDTSSFSTVDDFKAAVSRQSSIPAQYIVALNTQGRPVKFQSLPIETEICVYDIRMSQPASPGDAPPAKLDVATPAPRNLSDPPNQINDTKSQQSWQELFRNRQTWVARAVQDCALMARTAKDRYEEMDVMLRCLDAAVANLESVVKVMEPKYQDLKKWAGSAQTEYNLLVTRWESYLGLARSIPISAEMATFMTGRNMTAKNRPPRQPTLEDLLDLDTVKRTGRQAPQALRKFNQRLGELDKMAARMFQNWQDVAQNFEQVIERSAMSHEGEAAQLLDDIEAIAKKIDSDYQTTLELSNTTNDIRQASKLAAHHTEKLLPFIKKRFSEMDGMLRYATQARNALALESTDLMRTITDVTSLTATVKTHILTLSSEKELATFDYLRLIQQVPFMYASFAIEAMKRREWYEKVKTDASTLANEMALFQDEESKRRRKWTKSVENMYGPEAQAGSGSVIGLEVSLQGQEDKWPSLTRQDLTDFYEALQNQKAEQEILNDIGKLIVDLNNPTKQQSKRIKAFKNGSVHEASLGKSGLLVRGDEDMLRSIQDEKSRVESKLKTAESRVRRLEDLLHRQSSASRPLSQNIFPLSGQQLVAGNANASVTSVQSHDRRRSSVEMPDSMLNQRIQQLEAELSAEKEKTADMSRDLSVRTTQHEKVLGQMADINSTKNDLLQNMEAQKREFVVERKSLEDEIRQLKARIEDNEDEMEHFGDSRENEKVHYDAKVQSLEDEIAKITKQQRDDVLKYEGQVDFLRKESKLQREQVDNLGKQLQLTQDENKMLSKQLDSTSQIIDTQLKALHDIHHQLAPHDKIVEDLDDFIESLLNKCAGLLEKAKNLEGDLSIMRTDLQDERTALEEVQAEKMRANTSLANEETVTLRLREELDEEKARAGALEGELEETRSQLNELRTRMADGETGSESLRKRLEEEERKITTITEDLASKQSHVGSLEEELRLFKDKYEETQARLGVVNDRFAARTGHLRDLTHKLYTQNDRLCRLLERLNFSVTRKDGTMVIQKIPRAERSTSLNDSTIDPSVFIRRSGTLSISPDDTDLELLHWMNHSDQGLEDEKYEAFMSELGAFEIDIFTETVYKRIKDVEHMARKLQRDARSYRDKAHAHQKEAHDKIAFKNFKDGDLALFLPTRNQMTGAWAAFNIGFPHYFLREQESHRLRNREWLLARISRVQERVVDLSKSLSSQTLGNGGGGASAAENESIDEENDNPFDLSDGLRWYLIDAQEDKPGAPSTPGLGKTTVAANKVDAVAEKSHIRNASSKAGLGLVSRAPTAIDGVSKTLSKSLESRRSSTSSKRAMPFGIGGKGSALASEVNSLRAAAAESPDAAAETVAQSSNTQLQDSTIAVAANAQPAAPSEQQQQQQQEDVKQGHESRYHDLLGP